ncbi:DUF6880 family protein [Asticcacaulis sp. YBE204]|uniref:DUF6880 family protein n=1 Tax=Asticcacaulis sp. YBE204 TaxID=1282363 RepID=UPI0003C40261|nr:DUF6880 family protein [Asticcacaulis sp. YBE204]ESQ78967.1 hypothetical protein AEYBE204_11125 [Asticcacaulis sp. YBE204]
MASKTTLNATNLEALGAERLAALLMEISTGDANAKRRLRMELAGQDSPDKLAAEIRKRLTTIAAAETMIGWRTLKTFRADLHSQRRLIVEQVAPAAPAEALSLIGQFLRMSNAVLERASDNSGEMLALFAQAAVDFGAIAASAQIAPPTLIPQVVELLIHNGYGQADPLVAGLVPTLGDDGLVALRGQLETAAAIPEKAAAPKSRRMSKWRRNRTLEYSFARRRSRADSLRVALEAIADALGDVDAFIALQPSRRTLATALRIAERQLSANRAEDALATLDGVTERPRDRPPEWTRLRVEALQVAGHSEEAQALRLDTFLATLDATYLREHLKRLPDFDDIEAEDEALDRAMSHPDAGRALDLLIAWPSLERAARLIIERIRNLNGDDEAGLTAAADRLAARYPLAATLLLRKVVESILFNAHSDRYKAAAAAVWEIERLDPHIEDYGASTPHAEWLGGLRKTYRHRVEFWRAVDE